MSVQRMTVTIWFLCGVILTVYGIAVVGSGIYNVYNPPPVKVAYLHLDLWWGIVLTITGAIFVLHQWPGRVKKRLEE
ncbi:MAG TPA: hypothetical protein VJ417_07130 [Candidatus Glassbacteria bacterium]|nr:hypothetical protein [Candidatus Glassbacteria bacterium]